MLVFQWNALQVGDRVQVHDDRDPGFELSDGTVRLVQTHEHAANDVGIRVTDAGGAMVHPRRHAVHVVPRDERTPCWRCDVVAARSAPVTAGATT